MKKREEQLLREAIKLVLNESMSSDMLRKTIDAIKKRRTSTSSSSKGSYGGGYGGYGGGYGYGYGYGDYGGGSPWGYLSRDSSLAKSFQSSGIRPNELYSAAKENKIDLSKVDKADLEKILMSYVDSKIESEKSHDLNKSTEADANKDPLSGSENTDNIEGDTAGEGDGFGDGFGTI